MSEYKKYIITDPDAEYIVFAVDALRELVQARVEGHETLRRIQMRLGAIILQPIPEPTWSERPWRGPSPDGDAA